MGFRKQKQSILCFSGFLTEKRPELLRYKQLCLYVSGLWGFGRRKVRESGAEYEEIIFRLLQLKPTLSFDKRE